MTALHLYHGTTDNRILTRTYCDGIDCDGWWLALNRDYSSARARMNAARKAQRPVLVGVSNDVISRHGDLEPDGDGIHYVVRAQRPLPIRSLMFYNPFGEQGRANLERIASRLQAELQELKHGHEVYRFLPRDSAAGI